MEFTLVKCTWVEKEVGIRLVLDFVGVTVCFCCVLVCCCTWEPLPELGVLEVLAVLVLAEE